MTKARDTANLVATGVPNSLITLDAAEIPNISTDKLTSGTLANARVADLPTSKITSGTFADARISASSVTAHVTATDLQPLKADLTALALREATNEASAAFNLPNQFIETFTDDTNLGTQTDGDRDSGNWSSSIIGNTPSATTNLILHFDNNTNDSSSVTQNPTDTTNAPTFTTSIKKFGTHSAYFDASKYILFNQGDGGTWFGSGDWAIDFWCKADADSTSYRAFYGHQGQDSSNYHQMNYHSTTVYLHSFNDVLNTTTGVLRNSGSVMANFAHVLIQRYNNTLKIWVDGTLCAPTSGLSLSKNFDTTNDFGIGWDGVNAKYLGHIDEFRLCKHAPTVTSGDALYVGNDTGNFTPPTAPYSLPSTNATATLIQSANIVASAKTKVGGTMLYKDNSGTATLGTDLKIYFSCNNGGAWTEAASYNAITPVYSTGIKQVRLGETTCTSGTGVIYKAVWANQASGSKETQLHGIGINY